MGASTKSSPEPDLDALDESWDADEPEPDDEPDEDVDSLEAGWGDPKRGRTAAEKARAREEKARLRAQRQKARAAAIAQKQKPKQKKRPSTPPKSAAPAARRGEPATEEDELESSPEPAAPKRAVKSLPRAPAKDWLKMGIAVAIIVALGLIVRFVSREELEASGHPGVQVADLDAARHGHRAWCLGGVVQERARLELVVAAV